MTPAEFDAWLETPRRRPLVMGVLNVTPDSFSDGGRFSTVDAARRQAETMLLAGADLIDIGGETTKPGSARVDAEEQIRRVVPVLNACRGLNTTFSIDTTLSRVAGATLDAGAYVVNDISAGRDDPELIRMVAERGCPVCLMHMLGQPATMQNDPAYSDVVAEVRSFLNERCDAFTRAGVRPGRLLVDPGIGFGKSLEHNLDLLAATRQFVADGRPVLVGVSRKGFIGTLTGRTKPDERIFGTSAAISWVVTQGAAIVRVHDVAEMKEVVAVADAIGRRLPMK
ncbi:MAG: dihydropteroate synthase [Tepidisphaeraceae bacterium]